MRLYISEALIYRGPEKKLRILHNLQANGYMCEWRSDSGFLYYLLYLQASLCTAHAVCADMDLNPTSNSILVVVLYEHKNSSVCLVGNLGIQAICSHQPYSRFAPYSQIAWSICDCCVELDCL